MEEIKSKAQRILDNMSDYPHPGIDRKNVSVPLGSRIPSGS
jgi:hypothetical protein